MYFRGPSKVGDRIVIRSRVNSTFDKRWVSLSEIIFKSWFLTRSLVNVDDNIIFKLILLFWLILSRHICTFRLKFVSFGTQKVFFNQNYKFGDNDFPLYDLPQVWGMSFPYSFLPFMLDYQSSMEVGVRVEAYETGGQVRHIQSAYITFISPDKDGNPEQLPAIARTTKVVWIYLSVLCEI